MFTYLTLIHCEGESLWFFLAFRCVMKMDHHCPWINNCCGHLNHAYFTSFLLLAPLGCSHAAIIFIMTMYTQLYERVVITSTSLCLTFLCFLQLWEKYRTSFFSYLQISFGWSTVKIDMSAVRQFQPLMPFSVPAFAATLFALGLALGTTIAVGMLFFIQVSSLFFFPLSFAFGISTLHKLFAMQSCK